jgi:hypothetical protein
MSFVMDGLHTLLLVSTPSLPLGWAMHAGLALGWAVVLAALGAWLTQRFSVRTRRLVAAVLAVWALLPGPFTPDYWLGLAFHAPSLTSMLLCGWWLRRSLFGVRHAQSEPEASSHALWPVLLVGLGLVVGYVLMLDTFAVLPWEVYAWGFSPMLLLVLLLVSLLPWVLGGPSQRTAAVPAWVLPVALLLFAGSRLPTGNVWDAVMDPLLWLYLHGVAIRAIYRRIRRSAV